MGLTRSQYNRIMSGYQERRIKNSVRQRERTAEVYRSIPEIREADEHMKALALENARDIIAGRAEDSQRCREEIDELKEIKKRLLKAGGFSADYLDMTYDCMYCKDTGYVNGKKCRCFRKQQLEFLYAQSGLKEILGKENFDTFREDVFDSRVLLPYIKKTEREYMSAVKRECIRFCEHFGDNEKTSLLFTGPTGTGKTFLTNCISKMVLDMGYSVIYMTAIELFDLLAKAHFGENDEQVSDNRDMLFQCDLLAIDDLGTEMRTDFTDSQLFSLLNYRMIHRRSTLISTNLSMQTIGDLYTDRVASRIMSEYMVIPFYGKDLRLQGGKNGS